MAYWQDFAPPAAPPRGWQDSYAATMPDGSRLLLPLRDLGDSAVAGLIANQASFTVLDRLVGWLAARVAPWRPEVVVGLPTLGHAVAAALARALGHPHWAPAGFSRKLWYQESLSVPVTSITSPGSGRRLWLDPRLLERLAGRRVLLVDDVVSTGTSLRAGLHLLDTAGIAPVGVGVLMLQGDRWRAAPAPWPPLAGVFATPLFARTTEGWQEIPGTAPHDLCA